MQLHYRGWWSLGYWTKETCWTLQHSSCLKQDFVVLDAKLYTQTFYYWSNTTFGTNSSLNKQFYYLRVTEATVYIFKKTILYEKHPTIQSFVAKLWYLAFWLKSTCSTLLYIAWLTPRKIYCNWNSLLHLLALLIISSITFVGLVGQGYWA